MFADDTNMFYTSGSLTDLFSTINFDLNRAKDWFGVNKLTLNIKKCNYMLFHRKQRKISGNQSDLLVKISGFQIERVKVTKFLGVYIDEYLSWESQIDHIANKITKYIPLFYKLHHLIPEGILKIIYFSLIQSSLIYCNTVWKPTLSTQQSKILIAHKKLVRAMSGAPRSSHTAPLYRRLQILTTESIDRYMAAFYVFRSLHNLNSFSGFTRPPSTGYNTRMSTRDIVHLPSYRSDHSRKSVLYACAVVWNSLPNYLKAIERVENFKLCLKHYLRIEQ